MHRTIDLNCQISSRDKKVDENESVAILEDFLTLEWLSDFGEEFFAGKLGVGGVGETVLAGALGADRDLIIREFAPVGFEGVVAMGLELTSVVESFFSYGNLAAFSSS